MKFIVIGGGIAGLVSAYQLRENHPTADIKLIESSFQLGGMLRGVSYNDQDLYFDIGTHIFQETGIRELDQIIFESIDAEKLIHYPIGQGDIAGAVFNGQLQNNSFFPDLRKHHLYESLSVSIRKHIQKEKVGSLDFKRDMPVKHIAYERFGSEYADSIVLPILENMYNLPVQSLAGFSMLLPGLTRVILDDYEEWFSQLDNELYRSIVAVPNQFELPISLQHTRRSYYSKELGTYSFISGLTKKLSFKSVDILTNTKVLNIDLKKQTLRYKNNNNEQGFYDTSFDGLILATGAIPAAFLLGVDISLYDFEKPMKHLLINILLDEPSLSELFYFYGLDIDCEWYRITNYRAFTRQDDDLRITIEVLDREIEDPISFIKKIFDHLCKVGFLRSKRFRFFDIISLPLGFPKPTTKNMSSLNRLGLDINRMLPDNVILGGVAARENNFFQNEVLTDIFKQVNIRF